MEHETNGNNELHGQGEERQLTWAEQQEQAVEAWDSPSPIPATPVQELAAPAGGLSQTMPESEQPGEVFELLESGPKKAPKMKSMLAAGLAVVVLGAGSIVAMKQFQSADSAGSGAATADAAVAQFFDSLSNEDFLGAAEVMEPAERRTMVNPGIEMVGELQRLGILADEMSLGAVPGIDLQFDNMTYTPQSLGGGGDVVRVKVDGTVTGSGDASEIPYGSIITDNLPADMLAELTAEGEQAMESSVESIDDLGVVAVQRDGEWYVSLWYSIAEAVRLDSGVEGLPAFGQGPTPTGGESPEDAVWAMASAVENLNVAEMISVLDPEEAAALYDYSNLFLPEAQRELEAEAGDGAVIDFSRIDMRSETNGDDGQVWVDGFAIEFQDGEEHIKIDTDAECMVENLGEGYCEVSKSEMEEMGGMGMGIVSLPTTSSIRVHNVDGRWYMSPMATVMQPMLETIRGIERDQLQGWIDDPESLFEESGPLESLGLPAALVLGRAGSFGEPSFVEVSEAVTTEPDFDEEAWEQLWQEQPWTDEQWNDPRWTEAELAERRDYEDFFFGDDAASTTTIPNPDGPVEFEDEPADGESPATSVPAFTFDAPGTTPDTVPSTTVPATQTTIPLTSTTVVPVGDDNGDAEETVIIFRVLEPSPAGTSAWSILAEPVEVTPEEAAQYVGALTEKQAGEIEGWVSLQPVEPGDVLRFEWFIDE